ncbi:MAG TPA: hypothetical protein PKY82_16925 [Pyrinomonadaceae bacterium]|nr:hypothetical protein [Pyrinomonadaceae bacterium]
MFFAIFSILVMLFIVLVPVAFVGGIIFLIIRASKKGQQRVQDFQNFARQSNWQYAGKVPLSSLRGTEYLYLFSLGNTGNSFNDAFTIKLGTPEYKRIENLIYGTINNFQVSIFDYIYTTGSGKNYKGHSQTVVMLESPALNLPLFTMRPEGIWQEVGQVFGGQDIDFTSHPIFSKKYLLRGADENRVRYIFNQTALSFLETTTDFCIEGGGNRLFAYRQHVSIDPPRFQMIIDEALRTANLLSR